MVTWPLVHTAERTGRPSTETSVVSSEARAQGRAQGCRESIRVPTWLLVQIHRSVTVGAPSTPPVSSTLRPIRSVTLDQP